MGRHSKDEWQRHGAGRYTAVLCGIPCEIRGTGSRWRVFMYGGKVPTDRLHYLSDAKYEALCAVDQRGPWPRLPDLWSLPDDELGDGLEDRRVRPMVGIGVWLS